MHHVPRPGLTAHAVAGQLERGVRQHSCSSEGGSACTHGGYSLTLARPDFTDDRCALPSRRRCLEPKVGFVGLRRFGTCEACSMASCRRANASDLLLSRLRPPWALMTKTPSPVIRASALARSRSFTAVGKAEAAMLKRMCTALDTLFTFWPPGPWARMALNSTSDSGTT